MDPLSVAGSFIAVVNITKKLAEYTRATIRQPKNADRFVESLIATTTTYEQLIHIIQENPKLLSSERSLHLVSLLEQTRSILTTFSEDFAPRPGGRGLLKIPSLNEIDSLERLRGSLIFELKNLRSFDDETSSRTLGNGLEPEIDIELAEDGLAAGVKEEEWVVKLKPRYKQFLKRTIFKQETNGLITLPLNKARNQLLEDCEIQVQEFGDALESQHTRKSDSITDDDLSTAGSAFSTSDNLLGLHLVVCDVHSKCIRPSTISFSKRGFIRIMADFQLPGEFFHVLFTGTPVLLRLEDSKECHLSYVMRTPLSTSENWTVALTFDDVSRTTFAVVHGFQQKELRCLLHEMDEFKASSSHPLLLPALMCELLIEADSSGIKRLAAELFAVENRTIWHGYWQPGKDESLSQPQNPEQDFEDLTRTLNRIIARLAFHEMRINANIALISKLRFNVLDDKEEWRKSVHPEEAQAIVNPLDQRLSNLQVEHNALLLEIACNQKIADGQLQIVYSLIAQHDNKENLRMAEISAQIAAITKEDSFAMRTIAVMTIAFLPATAISSMFSMGMFNWQADEDDTVISSRFWIYWAVAVPLTLSVLGLWTIYVHRHKKNEGEIFSEKVKRLSTKRKEQHAVDRQGKGLRAFIPGLRSRAAGTKKDDEFDIGSSGNVVKAATRTSLFDHQLPKRADTLIQGPLR